MQNKQAPRSMRRWIVVLWALTCAMNARGQSYPERPITFVVPYPAGNAGDVIARQMAPIMRSKLGQPLIVENVAGASGGIGIQRALAGPSDGYVVVLGSPNDLILAPIAHPALAYRAEQFRLVGVAIEATFALVGRRQDSPTNFDELLAAARRPGARELSYGTFGDGSLPHLIGQDFAARLGLRMLHVPYRGTPQVLQDLIGGQIDLAFVPLAGAVLEHVSSGRLVAYTVTSARRHPVLPAVPTADENADLNGFQYNSWLGLFVERDVPESIVVRLHDALQATLLDTQFRQGIEASGSSVAALVSLSVAQQHFIEETATHRNLAKRIGALPRAESASAPGASNALTPGRR
jgi:tripartite-type tricarboxylate transporter receptor subunit TctC